MRKTILFRRMRTAIRIYALSFLTIFVLGQIAVAQEEPVLPEASPNSAASGAIPPAIVIGFVGGFVKHDNLIHSEVQLAASLRKAYPSGVDVETFESYHGDKALKEILNLLDANHDGKLSPAEKHNARIIIYGHSWGGSETIELARELQKENIPVLLTIQVDSISKLHQDDAVIPANVAQAANFYQPDGWVHGQSAIRAADPAHTKIIGNFRSNYRTVPYTCNEYPWYDHFLVRAHTQIECDPNVWKQVEGLIQADLPPASGNGSKP